MAEPINNHIKNVILSVELDRTGVKELHVDVTFLRAISIADPHHNTDPMIQPVFPDVNRAKDRLNSVSDWYSPSCFKACFHVITPVAGRVCDEGAPIKCFLCEDGLDD